MQAIEAINDCFLLGISLGLGLTVGQFVWARGSYVMHIGVQEESRRTGWGSEA